MEAAHLISAHALAQEALQSSRSTLATADKHRAAASEFTKAAQGVEDSEALRVLNLLGQHHQRLASIITSGLDIPTSDVSDDASTQPSPAQTSSLPSPTNPIPPNATLPLISEETAQSSRSQVVQRRPARDLSSSIASNLATARGIPAPARRAPRAVSPPSHDVIAGVAYSQLGQRSSRAARNGSGETRSQPMSASMLSLQSAQRMSSRETFKEEKASTPTAKVNEDSFQKFYSTFEGLLSRLSAPLAFAGLPLLPEEQAELKLDASLSAPRTTVKPMTFSTKPDISKIISKAALRAVKDDRGSSGVQESFFVVPTGGGTVSYAGVLSRTERQARHQSLEPPLELQDDEAAEQFMDAREMPHPQFPKTNKKESRTSPAANGGKTVEELEIENKSLKQLTDNLSRRLYMWEKSAQSQSMALQQSIRNLQPSPKASPEIGHIGATTEDNERMRQLEEQISSTQKENAKLKTVVLRYRERWERLKEGARSRREGAEKGGGTDSPVGES